MENWQKSRNYRRIKDEDGRIIAHIITVDGVDVEVTEEVFLAYSQADRRERYIREKAEPGRVLSLDKLLEDGVPLDCVGVEQEISAEESVLKKERENRLEHWKALLPTALKSLRAEDLELVQALFFEGASTRDYARRIGVSQRAVIKRRDRILKDLKNFLDKCNMEGIHYPGIREGD